MIMLILSFFLPMSLSLSLYLIISPVLVLIQILILIYLFQNLLDFIINKDPSLQSSSLIHIFSNINLHIKIILKKK